MSPINCCDCRLCVGRPERESSAPPRTIKKMELEGWPSSCSSNRNRSRHRSWQGRDMRCKATSREGMQDETFYRPVAEGSERCGARLERGAALEGRPGARLEQLYEVDAREAVDGEDLLKQRGLLWSGVMREQGPGLGLRLRWVCFRVTRRTLLQDRGMPWAQAGGRAHGA